MLRGRGALQQGPADGMTQLLAAGWLWMCERRVLPSSPLKAGFVLKSGGGGSGFMEGLCLPLRRPRPCSGVCELNPYCRGVLVCVSIALA